MREALKAAFRLINKLPCTFPVPSLYLPQVREALKAAFRLIKKLMAPPTDASSSSSAASAAPPLSARLASFLEPPGKLPGSDLPNMASEHAGVPAEEGADASPLLACLLAALQPTRLGFDSSEV